MYVMSVHRLKYSRPDATMSNASNTTICLSPLNQEVHEKFGLVEGHDFGARDDRDSVDGGQVSR